TAGLAPVVVRRTAAGDHQRRGGQERDRTCPPPEVISHGFVLLFLLASYRVDRTAAGSSGVAGGRAGWSAPAPPVTSVARPARRRRRSARRPSPSRPSRANSTTRT